MDQFHWWFASIKFFKELVPNTCQTASCRNINQVLKIGLYIFNELLGIYNQFCVAADKWTLVWPSVTHPHIFIKCGTECFQTEKLWYTWFTLHSQSICLFLRNILRNECIKRGNQQCSALGTFLTVSNITAELNVTVLHEYLTTIPINHLHRIIFCLRENLQIRIGKNI